MITVERLSDHLALILENDQLKVIVLPEKGADILSFFYKANNTEFLLKSPDGLNRPPARNRPDDFLQNYEGGWQELFPNTNDSCDYRGARLPFHGEVALLPWDYVIESDDDSGMAVRLSVECALTPFRLQRLMTLRKGSPTLHLEETVTNISERTAEFVWGHHVVLGGDFLEEGCRIEVPSGRLITPDKLYEPETARLAERQSESWPMVRDRARQGWVDLSYVPGPDAHSHDDVFLTDLAAGQVSVINPRLGLEFALKWDLNIFQGAVLWQPYGGADQPPLTGIYGLGIEPWVSRHNLDHAIRHGEAITLNAHQSITTQMSAEVMAI